APPLGAPGLDRIAQPEPLGDPPDRDPAGDPRPGLRQRAGVRRRWRHHHASRLRRRRPRGPWPGRRCPDPAGRGRMTDRIGFEPTDPDKVPDFDHDRAEAAIRELLFAIGEDPEREGLRDTPARVARAY